jgi:hypothetical protein
MTHSWRERNMSQQMSYCRNTMDGHRRQRAIEGPITPRSHFLGQRGRDQLDLLVSVAAFLRWFEGDEPMQVRMSEGGGHAAGVTLAAGLRRAAFAQQRLSEPESQALLPDPPRSFEEQRLGQPTGRGCGTQAAAHGFMTV